MQIHEVRSPLDMTHDFEVKVQMHVLTSSSSLSHAMKGEQGEGTASALLS